MTIKLFLGVLLCAAGCLAQALPVLKASWIAVPGVSQQDYGVYHFRRSFDLGTKPRALSCMSRRTIAISCLPTETVSRRDRRARDLTHWRFETIDLAPHLKAGRNVLAAVVWNDGAYRAIAQISSQTGFLVDADGSAGDLVRTRSEWKCAVDRAYSPRPPEKDELTGYRAIAANESFDGKAYPWGWEQPDFDDSEWQAAERISPAALRDARDAHNSWMLVPYRDSGPRRTRSAIALGSPRGRSYSQSRFC